MNAMTSANRLGTRDTILSILRRRDGVSVDDFARELELSGATVRRHLDVLLRDDLVRVEQVRGRTGRPRYAYSLTEAGAERLGHHYVRITHRLVEEIGGLSGADTTDRQGVSLAEMIFQRMTERLVRAYQPRVAGQSVAERLHSAVDLLGSEGVAFEVVADGEAWLLLGRGCPCHRLNGAHIEGCEHDRRLIEQVVGATTEVVGASDLPNAFMSGYRVLDRPHEVS